MKRLILALLLLSTALAASEVLVIEMDLTNDNIVTIIDTRLMTGSETIAEGTNYSINLLSDSSELLHTTYFDVLFTAYGNNYPFLPGQEDVGVAVNLSEVRVLVRVPYLTEATSYQVMNGETVLATQTINLCNTNGVCDFSSGENYLSCLIDCPSGGVDDYCDEIFDGICDPDCGAQGRADKDTDCTCGDSTCDAREDSITCPSDCGSPSNEITNLIYMIVGGVIGVVVLIIIGIILLVKKKKKK